MQVDVLNGQNKSGKLSFTSADNLRYVDNIKMINMRINSMVISSKPTLIPDWRGSETTGHGRPRKEAKEVRLLAYVLMRMPNHATMYEPAIPKTVHSKMVMTCVAALPLKKPK